MVLEVNETCLGIETLSPLFTRVVNDDNVMRECFPQLVMYSQTMTLSGLYTPFGEIGVGALQMLADIKQVTLTESDISEFKTLISSMPAHADAVTALTRLREAGFRLVTLTNSASSASPTPLEKAGLSQYFEQHFSVETVGKFKPAPQTYQLVAETLGVETSDLCLVACHLWDTIGAQAAGCRGAFVKRPHNEMLSAPNVPVPDLSADDLSMLADKLISGKHI